MVETEILSADVLIVGGGGAGSRAAYEAKKLDPRLDVLLVAEGKWGTGGSTVWKASETLGINAPLNIAEDGDTTEIYLEDILRTGAGAADPHLAKIVALESSERINELKEMGVAFDRANGKLLQKKLSGCTRARSLARGGETGRQMVAVLKKAALSGGVRLIEGVRVCDLISHAGEVVGVQAIKGERRIEIIANAVILATGGAGALFPHNVNHRSLRGDGYAMAYRAGALLTNVEFIQIGPGVVYPEIPFIIHSHMWRFCPRLRNSAGEQFLGKYLPQGLSRENVLELKAMSFPFSVRTDAKYVDIAMYKEIIEGRGTVHGGVYFDVNHVSESQLMEKAPITFRTFLDAGINLHTDSIEIAPLVQNFNGGIKIDENAATNVPGLFAVGEVSGGVHGADRPGGNNLTDTQVFGYRGGRAAAILATERKGRKIQGVEGKTKPTNTRVNLEDVYTGMDRALMVVRSGKELLGLLRTIEETRQKTQVISIEDDNVLLNAEIIARSALAREESRGTHYREDFPATNPEYARPSFVRKSESGEMKVFIQHQK